MPSTRTQNNEHHNPTSRYVDSTLHAHSRPLPLNQPKQPPPPLLRLLPLPRLVLHLLLRNMAPQRIPRHRGHPNRRRRHAPEHRPDPSRVPPVVLRERARRQAREVRHGRVPRGVARDGEPERAALVVRELRDRVALLRDVGRFDELDGEADFEVPFDVA